MDGAGNTCVRQRNVTTVALLLLSVQFGAATALAAATTQPCHEADVNTPGVTDARSLYNEGVAEQSLGHYPLARQALSRAAEQSDAKRDPSMAACALVALGGVETAMR